MADSQTDIRIRPATAGDIGQIRDFIRQEKLNPFGLDWRRFTVAVANSGELVGCVQYKPHKPDVVELASLVVAPKWRGHGVGKTLVIHLQQKHGPPLWLMCAKRTAPYYMPLGFNCVTQAEDMPPYFRRIFRIAAFFQKFLRRDNHLSIMVWSPEDLPKRA